MYLYLQHILYKFQCLCSTLSLWLNVTNLWHVTTIKSIFLIQKIFLFYTQLTLFTLSFVLFFFSSFPLFFPFCKCVCVIDCVCTSSPSSVQCSILGLCAGWGGRSKQCRYPFHPQLQRGCVVEEVPATDKPNNLCGPVLGPLTAHSFIFVNLLKFCEKAGNMSALVWVRVFFLHMLVFLICHVKTR